MVLCIDEKTAIQALDRLDPVLPLSSGRAERRGSAYYRLGTHSLYAALEVATGRVSERSRRGGRICDVDWWPVLRCPPRGPIALDGLSNMMLTYAHSANTLASKASMDTALSDLGRRERQIMDILVRRRRATASEVLSDLPDPPSYSAVRGMLRLLESKGYVLHEWEGPRYVYVPASNPERLKRDAVSHLLRTFFDGSTEAAVSMLLETSERSLTREELGRLGRLIADAKKRAIGV